jgi:predicted amidohydrolase YtcJ
MIGATAPQADLIITNGKIYTVDEKEPYAEAVAVWRDRIVAVGKLDAMESSRIAGQGMD